MIREEGAESLSFALKQNLSIMKFHIDLNPIKHATIKDLELSVKRNVVRHKEKQAPAIQKEISSLYKERQKVFEELPKGSKNANSIIETAIHIDKKAQMCEKAKTIYKD